MIYRMEKLRLRVEKPIEVSLKSPLHQQVSRVERRSFRLRTDDVIRSGRWKKRDSSEMCSHVLHSLDEGGPAHTLRYSNCK